DDDLRAVGEVAELRLPEHQRMRIGEAVAVFEAEHRRFGERAVDDLERRLTLPHMIDWDVALFGFLVDEHGVALREGAAARILAGEANEGTLGTKRTEGERLARRPIDALAAFDRLALRLELTRDLAVEVETFGHGRERMTHFRQLLDRDGRLAAPRIAGGDL